jgi:hypothetical protein
MAAVVANPTAASESTLPKQLNPRSAWRLDYGKEKCALVQEYTGDGDTVLLEIDSYGSQEGFQVILSGKGIPSTSGITRAVVRFAGDPAGRTVNALAGTTSQGAAAIFLPLSFVPYEQYERRTKADDVEDGQSELPDRAFADYQRTIHEFVVGLGSASVIQLNVGDIAKPLDALRTCVDKLVSSWGVEPAVQDSLSRPAMPDMVGIRAVQARYPESMLRNLESTLIYVRVNVDAGGNATSCVLQTPTADSGLNAELTQNICGSLRHFRPALDANGKAVASVLTTRVSYNSN